MFLTKVFQSAYHKISGQYFYSQDVILYAAFICWWYVYIQILPPCFFSHQGFPSLSELSFDFLSLSSHIAHSPKTYFYSLFRGSHVSSSRSHHAPWGRHNLSARMFKKPTHRLTNLLCNLLSFVEHTFLSLLPNSRSVGIMITLRWSSFYKGFTPLPNILKLVHVPLFISKTSLQLIPLMLHHLPNIYLPL